MTRPRSGVPAFAALIMIGSAVLALLSVLSVLWPGPAHAHAFAVRYDLPMPLSLYLWGAGAAVALSFAIMAVAGLRDPAAGMVPARTIPLPRRLSAVARWGCGGFGLAVLALLVIAGQFGTQSPLKNIAPVTVWVMWWVGFAYLVALIGNPWPMLDPWRAAADLVARNPARAPPAGGTDAWPAVALLLVFAWIELIWPGSERPAALAGAIIAYSVIAWAAMAIFGRAAWRRSGDIFAILFAVIGRFAPFAGTRGPDGAPALVVRPWAAGLLARRAQSPAVTLFVITMLAAVTYDGFLETPAWHDLKRAAFAVPDLAPLWFWLRDVTGDHHAAFETIGLLVFPLLFLAAFRLTCALMRLAGPVDHQPLAGWFVLSLVPIAIAYHLSHYLSYFLIAGQMIIPALSDPLGLGWDLFGTARYRIDIAVIDARTVWTVSVVSIVLGHVIAVYLAHVTALSLFPTVRRAVTSQLPMLVLMVAYTTISLWILAQPIVDG